MKDRAKTEGINTIPPDNLQSYPLNDYFIKMSDHGGKYTVVVGKIRIWPYNTIKLKEGLSSLINCHESIERHGKVYKWVIAGADFSNIEGRDVFFGRLGIYKKGGKILALNEKAWDFEFKDSEDNQGLCSNFLIDLESQIIAYQIIHGTITEKEFHEILNQLYIKSHHKDELAETQIRVDPLHIESDLWNVLSSAEKVTFMHFDLTPTNPKDDPIIDPLDFLLKESKSDRLVADLENKNTGLNVNSKIFEPIFKKLSHGYGRFKFLFIEDGRTRDISSEKKAASGSGFIVKEIIKIPLDKGQIKIEFFRIIKKYLNNKDTSKKDDEQRGH